MNREGKITVTIRLDKDIHDGIKEEARRDRRSITGQVEYILMKWLLKSKVEGRNEG